MKTTVGIQGDEAALTTAREKYRQIQREYWQDKSISYDRHKERESKIIFVMTWQDTLSNLSYVMKHVKKRAPKIIAQKIDPVQRKGRRDVFILSKDNLKFKKVFYETLSDLIEQENNTN